VSASGLTPCPRATLLTFAFGWVVQGEGSNGSEIKEEELLAHTIVTNSAATETKNDRMKFFTF